MTSSDSETDSKPIIIILLLLKLFVAKPLKNYHFAMIFAIKTHEIMSPDLLHLIMRCLGPTSLRWLRQTVLDRRD